MGCQGVASHNNNDQNADHNLRYHHVRKTKNYGPTADDANGEIMSECHKMNPGGIISCPNRPENDWCCISADLEGDNTRVAPVKLLLLLLLLILGCQSSWST